MQSSILIVDDRPENLLAMEGILAGLGQSLVFARSGREALKHMLASDFAVVLLDVQMPGMDGFETAELIRQRPRSRQTPIIFVTAYSTSEAAATRGYELGAVDFLFKPIVATVLRAKVQAFVDLHAKTEQIREQAAALVAAEQQQHARRLAEARQRWEADLLREAVAKEKQTARTLKENLERMRELEQARDDLTHMIVHDLRTPLTSVITGLQAIGDCGELNGEQTELIDMALRGGQNLLGLINDLLDVGRMESGAMELEYERIAPTAIVQQALQQIHWLALEKGLRLQAQYDEDLPEIEADPGKMQRVLVNLLGNAVKFTPTGGDVILIARAGPGPEHTSFTVQDTGEGIPRQALARIFEKFGQVASRKAGRRMSTGLGLTFCKLAVEAHGGSIAVESEVGMGSAFTFCVPNHRTVVSQPCAPATLSPAGADTRGRSPVHAEGHTCK